MVWVVLSLQLYLPKGPDIPRKGKNKVSLQQLMYFYYPPEGTILGQIEQGNSSGSLKGRQFDPGVYIDHIYITYSIYITHTHIQRESERERDHKIPFLQYMVGTRVLMSSFPESIYSLWYPGQMASLEVFLPFHIFGGQDLLIRNFKSSSFYRQK